MPSCLQAIGLLYFCTFALSDNAQRAFLTDAPRGGLELRS